MIRRPCHEQNAATVISTRERFCACDRTAKKIFSYARSDQMKKRRKELYSVANEFAQTRWLP